MKNYIFNKKDLLTIAELGILKCEVCNNYQVSTLEMNIKTNEKYLLCYDCEQPKNITNKQFETLLVYSKFVPQDRDLIINIWETLIKINDKYTLEFMNRNSSKNFDSELKELKEKIFNIIKKEYPSVETYYLETMTAESIRYFVNSVFKYFETKDDEESEKNQEKKETKKTYTKEEIYQKLKIFMKTYYQKTINNIKKEESELFNRKTLLFTTTVSKYENQAIIYDPYNEYRNISDELFSIKIVNSICKLYEYISEYEKLYPDYLDYEIQTKHDVEFEICSEGVDVNKISNTFFTDYETKNIILLKAFNNILKIFSKKNIELYKEQDKFHAKLICDFINNEYYRYGVDIGTALFIYKNNKYFNNYIHGENKYKTLLNLVKKLEINNEPTKQIIEKYEEPITRNYIYHEENEFKNNYTQEEKSNSNWGFWLSIAAIFIHIFSFFSFYKCYKAIKSMKENKKKYNKLAVAGFIISSLYVFEYVLALTTWIAYLT